MPRVTYVGPSLTGVDLPLPDGRIILVGHGAETPELPDDFAKSLLEQEANWTAAKAAAPKGGK